MGLPKRELSPVFGDVNIVRGNARAAGIFSGPTHGEVRVGSLAGSLLTLLVGTVLSMVLVTTFVGSAAFVSKTTEAV